MSKAEHQWVLTLVMALRPEQIKSVHNRGTFDPADPRMSYSRRPVTARTSPAQSVHGPAPVESESRISPRRRDGKFASRAVEYSRQLLKSRGSITGAKERGIIGQMLTDAMVGLPNTGRLNARSYLDWGDPVSSAWAQPGDVVVFWRGKPTGWQGHVAFLIRFDGDRVIVRGGNQGNRVSDASYPISQVLGIRRALGADEAGRVALRHGSVGQAVRDLQNRLRDLHYFAGRVDGDFGELTRAAVLAFQADNGVEVDGVVARETWGALDTATPRRPRDVTADDLRESGSRTVGAADNGQTLAAVGTIGLSLGEMADKAAEATRAVDQAAGLVDKVQALALSFWPILLIGIGGILLWHFFGKIKAARIDDAHPCRHIWLSIYTQLHR